MYNFNLHTFKYARKMKPASNYIIAHTIAQIANVYSQTIKTSCTTSKCYFKSLDLFHMHTYHSYTQSNGHILNLIPVMTSNSHSHIISHLQRLIFEAVVPSSFPIRFPDLSVSDGHLSNRLCHPLPALQESVLPMTYKAMQHKRHYSGCW